MSSWRKQKVPSGRVLAEVEEITLENDEGYEVDSVEVTCTKCGHVTQSYGTGEASVLRCLALLREECPFKQQNFYYTDDDE